MPEVKLSTLIPLRSSGTPKQTRADWSATDAKFKPRPLVKPGLRERGRYRVTMLLVKARQGQDPDPVLKTAYLDEVPRPGTTWTDASAYYNRRMVLRIESCVLHGYPV